MTTRKTRAPKTGATISGTARAEILEAAIRIFSQKTFEGTSLKEIAEAVNIGHPLVHYHFGSKEKLWQAAVQHVWADLERDYRMIIETTVDMEPIDTLKILCRSYAKFCRKYPQHIGLITNEMRVPGDRFEWLMASYIKPIHDHMNIIVTQAVEKKQIKPIPLAHLTINLFIPFSHFFSVPPLMKLIYDVDPADDGVASRHIDHVIDILFTGITLARPRQG